ncbi:hypothetical protein ACFWD7_45880, partial [Streptomyces mirabilis]|uniref:hypothetical protein n=1 Tax=Streptomyces mirabilis TaxID=68239 RepID=UPI0036C2FDAF
MAMDRFRTAAVVALPLLLPLLAAGPAFAAEPAPLPLGSVRSVHPGHPLAVTAVRGQAVNGDTITDFGVLGSVRSVEREARPGEEPAEDAVAILQ